MAAALLTLVPFLSGSLYELPITYPRVSGNGRVVAGINQLDDVSRVSTWTVEHGLRPIADPLGQREERDPMSGHGWDRTPVGISGDGRVIAGPVCLWRDYKPTLFPAKDASDRALIFCERFVSGSGNVVVGWSFSTEASSEPGLPARDSREKPCIWTPAAGFRYLATLPGSRGIGRALGASDDGAVIVGVSRTGAPEDRRGRRMFDDEEATVWIGAKPIALGRPNGAFSSVASMVSNDGKIVCGNVDCDDTFAAFLWTRAEGFTWITRGKERLNAVALSGDGKTVALDSGELWTREGGFKSIAAVCASAGVNAAGLTDMAVTDLSDDAKVMVGTALNPQAEPTGWYLKLP